MKGLGRILLALLVGLALGLGGSARAQAPGPSVPVSGQIISRTQGPVPGVTVLLVHPILGQSAPSYTDVYGRFGWSIIPVRPEPYFLEVWWGPNLIYRAPLPVVGPTQLPPIYL